MCPILGSTSPQDRGCFATCQNDREGTPSWCCCRSLSEQHHSDEVAGEAWDSCRGRPCSRKEERQRTTLLRREVRDALRNEVMGLEVEGQHIATVRRGMSETYRDVMMLRNDVNDVV